MITEMIGSTQLSAYGLKLARLDGNMDLPKFKSIIDESNYPSELRYLDEKTVSIKLIGVYANASALGSQVNSFNQKIRSAPKHVWKFAAHDFQETCIVNEGTSVNVFAQKAVEITMNLTITLTED